MRKILFAVIAILFFQVAHSQDLLNSNVRHYPGKVKYQKEEQDATIFEIPYPKDEVEVGLRKMAEARGVKVREKNGFFEGKNISIEKLNGRVCDMYYRVEKDGRAASKVYLILADPGEALAKRSSSHNALLAEAGGVAVVATVGTALQDNNHEMRIKDQENDIRKAEKEYNDLIDDQKKMEKKKAELEKDLEKNKQNQARMQKEIEARKGALDSFRGTKKPEGAKEW
jgi:hypothetical protein